MGICGSMIILEKNIDTENTLDKIILLLNFFIKDKLKKDQIKPFLSNLFYYQILSEKSDFVKIRRFSKWIEMCSIMKTFPFSNDINSIINSLQKEKNTKNDEKNYIKYDIFYKKGMKEISYTETGLRNYYIKNKTKFESRILKSPPGIFRFCSWLVLSEVELNREYSLYEKIITIKIKKKLHVEIIGVVEEIIKEKCEKSNLIKSCLFRLLKAIIILNPDFLYLKEISYILSFLIVISDFDEINIFYMIISLLSKKHLHGFFIKEKPLLNICIKLFEKNFEINFPELKLHFNEINFDFNSYIINWIHIFYINTFPIIYVLRIWDYFLVKGISFLVNFALSFIENFYEDLINIRNSKEFFNFIKKLNPDKYSLYPEIEFNIENIIINANKKYKITNEDIFNELKIEYPNYKLEFNYNIKNINEQTVVINDNYSISDEILSTIDRYGSIHSLSTVNNNDINICYYNLNNFIKKGNINLQENINDNIELSISQKNMYDNISENEFDDDIEDENNFYLHQHIKDLINKQEYYSLNSNFIK